jgi:hypothetical protein
MAARNRWVMALEQSSVRGRNPMAGYRPLTKRIAWPIMGALHR